MAKPHYRRLADGSTVRVHDGLQNALANLGTPRDKAFSATYGHRQRTQDELVAAYRTAWLARKIVDIIPMDATRRWRAWQADSVEITEIEAEERRLGVQMRLREAMTSARLLGGAVIYIGTGDRDVSQPLNVERIGRRGVKHLTVIGRDQISLGQMDQEPESATFGKPAWYQVGNKGVKIHPSRVVDLRGAVTPVGSPIFDQWGDSVLQPIFDAMTQADGTAANIATLTYEACVDVLRIPNLREMLLEQGGDAALTRYLTTLAVAKGNNGMLVLDGGGAIPGSEKRDPGTEYDRKPISFGGLGDIWDRMMQAVSGAADIPMTRLFGQSPGGLNSSGESDLRNYYDRVQGMQELELTPALATLDECLIRSALGSRPDDVHYNWRSLWQTTDKERAEVGSITAQIVQTLSGANLFPVETLQAAAANAIIETGALPGLEAAIKEHGLELDEDDGDDDEPAPEETEEKP
ncbi:DUF1073 domain-containing protein [Paracoccus sp. DMF]|uniref:DUF1073 domain-containing protein n=1 Tax=Paracoccus sp. DMF TaxID=400837 RepID=UPI001104DDCB|nr:anti-CBASS Acb1 family protein [Paracoccus sp. DMF]MCV2448470.1 DUF1073 domain-containing protein [Paracoccus sp. DMF]